MNSTETLSCPVSALSSDGTHVLVAMGNRVHYTNLSRQGTDPLHVVALPDGSAVTALLGACVTHTSRTRTEKVHRLALVGCADTLFAFSPSVSAPVPAQVLCTFGGRILLIHYSKEIDMVVVLTSLNTTFWVQGSLLWACVEETRALSEISACWYRQEGPALGVVLAADCISAKECSGQRAVVKFFAGTYAGHVSEWHLTLNAATLVLEGSTPPSVVSVVPSHRRSCALFSVKVQSLTVNDQVVECCATSSDDRTATVFVRTAGGQHWECWWRGSGESFSRARVFDVELHWDTRRSALLVATAHEDGHVHVEVLQATASPFVLPNGQVNSKVFSLLHLLSHKGHGAYRVSFAAGPRDGEDEEAARETGDAVYLLSGGFDGTVNATPLVLAPTAAAAEVLDASCLHGRHHFRIRVIASKKCSSSSEKDGGRGCHVGGNGASSVRGVHIDNDGRVIVLTESAATILDCVSGAIETNKKDSQQPLAVCWDSNSRSDISHDSPQVTGEDEVSSRRREGGGGKSKHGVPKEMLPARMVTFTLRGPATDPSPLTGLGVFTEGGYVVLVLLHQDAARRRPQVSTSLHAHGKVVLAEAMERHTDAASPPLLVTSHVSNHVVVSRVSCLDGADGMRLEVLFHFADGPGVYTTSFAWRQRGHNEGELAVAGSSSGTPTTLGGTAASTSPPVILLMGDRKGNLYTYDSKRHTVCVTTIFRNQAVAAIYQIKRSDDYNGDHDDDVSNGNFGEDGLFVIATDTGAYVVCTTSELTRRCVRADRQTGSCGTVAADADASPDFLQCLRFPFPMSSLLAATDCVWVTQLGHTVTVYERRAGRYGWHCRAAYADVKAPRLVRARVVMLPPAPKRRSGCNTRVYVAHCSDGEHVEGYACTIGEPPCAAKNQGQTSVLMGGSIPGKDFNAIVSLCDAPSNNERVGQPRCHRHRRQYALGNEDSTLTVVSFNEKESSDFPQTFAGPHHSNILSMQVLPTADKSHVRLVTAGGLATLAVWERVEDGAEAQDASLGSTVGAAAAARWRVLASCSEENADTSNRAAEAAGCDRVARFLSLCCAHLPTAVDGSGVLVGSSDATLRLYVLQPSVCVAAAGGATLTETASITLVNESECPKPIIALNFLEPASSTQALVDRRFFVAGDTNGRLAMVEMHHPPPHAHNHACTMVVRALRRTEQSCLNAISAGHLVTDAAGRHQRRQPPTWQCVVGHDSGTVHLVEIRTTIDAAEEASWEAVVLCSHRVGITAVRGVSWKGLTTSIFVLSEERVQQLSRVVDGDAPAKLALKKGRRINVRCASGFAVDDENDGEGGSGQCQSCVVVGQGYERVIFD